ncbi:MAG: DUF2271 domain-containing protein [Porticoccaceae bacterium]|nr:DUF2271 domain-containing protein [Porticoccaceae bacterium]
MKPLLCVAISTTISAALFAEPLFSEPLFAEKGMDNQAVVLGSLYGEPLLFYAGQNEEIGPADIDQFKGLAQEIARSIDSSLSVSEVSRVNAALGGKLSNWMLEIIQTCENWREQTENILSCRTGALTHQWEKLQATGTDPDRRELRELTRLARTADFVLDGDQLRFGRDIQWDFQLIAGPFTLDKLADWMDRETSLSNYRLSWSGTDVYRGSTSSLADENHWSVSLDMAGQSVELALNSGASSYITPWDRKRPIGRSNYQGLIDHSTGWVGSAHAAFVASDTALEAAAMAQLAALAPAQRIIERAEAEGHLAMLAAEDGRVQSTDDFYQLIGFASNVPSRQIEIEFELPDIEANPYLRPYISIWISDEAQAPVRNLLLLGQEPRWMQELRVWWRRVGRRNESVIDGLSGATRRPGVYRVQWDGRDDYGNLVAEGQYILHLEASREKGGRSYQKIPLSLTDMSEPIEVPGAEELGLIRIRTVSQQQTASNNF